MAAPLNAEMAAAAAAAAAKLFEGSHMSAAALWTQPCDQAAQLAQLSGLTALLNSPGGGAVITENGGLAPLLQLAAMQYSIQVGSISGEGGEKQPTADFLSALASNPLAAASTWPLPPGSAAGDGTVAPSNEVLMHYISALAAFGAAGAEDGAALDDPLLASAAFAAGDAAWKGNGAKVEAAAAEGGIKGGKGKAPVKGKGKGEKGKKSSPFEAEEVEVAATLALLRNHPNPTTAAAAKEQSARQAAAGVSGSYSSMVGAAGAAAKGKGAGVGLKREREAGKGATGSASGEAGVRRAGESDSNGEEMEPGTVMDDREARRMRRKKMRKLQKTLAVELDMLLPRLGANNKSYKWAGRRSVGRTGRSLVEILVDTAKSVKAIRSNFTNSDAAACSAGAELGAQIGGIKGTAGVGAWGRAGIGARSAGHCAFYKQGLLASQSMAILDVTLPDLTLLSHSDAFRFVTVSVSSAHAHACAHTH